MSFERLSYDGIVSFRSNYHTTIDGFCLLRTGVTGFLGGARAGTLD